MILATRRSGTRDGELLVVGRDRNVAVSARGFAATLRDALDQWEVLEPILAKLYGDLSEGRRADARPLDPAELMAPLPRAQGWLDGSAFLNHVILVRKARGAEPPATLRTDPLMYQGGSDAFLGPREDILVEEESWGIDFESEIAVITDDVPMGVSPGAALAHVKLLVVCNDVSLRNLIPDELAKGFGFLVSKPSTAFAPFAVTPEELGDSWRDGRVHLPLRTWWNGELFGQPDAGAEMHFSFGDLIAHAAKSRRLSAGTIVGSGTVSNADPARGSSCIAEKRMLEKINTGECKTPFLRFGDRVRIEMCKNGVSVFGAIDQKVARYQPARPVPKGD